jgi:putative oxidoreductase
MEAGGVPGGRKWRHEMKYLVLVGRLLVGCLFVYASIHRIFDPASFAASIRNYQVLPPEWSNMVAVTLPWIEIGVGVFLITGIQTRASSLLTTGMLAVFLAAIIRAYVIGLDIDCGCFSAATTSSGRIGPLTIMRDSLILLSSAVVLFGDSGDFSVGRVPGLSNHAAWINPSS